MGRHAMNAVQRLNALRRDAARLNAMPHRADLPPFTWRDIRRNTSAPAFHRSPTARTIAAEVDAVKHWRVAWRPPGGWYADPDQLTVYTPIVYRLPHGLLWPGYVEGDSDYVVLDDEPCDDDDETGARHRAEQMAERAAEEEHAYQERERERFDLETDIEDTTDTLRTLWAERSTLMRYAHGDADAAKIARRKADTIRATITTLRDLRSELTHYED